MLFHSIFLEVIVNKYFYYLLFLLSFNLAVYADLPDIIATHFNAQGEADDFGPKPIIWLLPSIGLVMFIGLFLKTVGLDGFTGEERYIFGIDKLMDGISFIPALIGLFAMSTVLYDMEGNPIPEDEGFLKKGIEKIKKIVNPFAGLMSQKPQAPPLPQTPMPNVATAALQKSPQTGLTRTETALLSPSEQVIARRT